jgi:hypothetical protein
MLQYIHKLKTPAGMYVQYILKEKTPAFYDAVVLDNHFSDPEPQSLQMLQQTREHFFEH